ncbi:MAG: hypothetical protein V8R55_08010 [Dysosmobacter sp.]
MRRVYKQINVDVGARLRACRERVHLTREAFAERVGITARFVQLLNAEEWARP